MGISVIDVDPQTTRSATALSDQTNHALLQIIRDNFGSQYATQVASLARFRVAILAHGGKAGVDATLLADFRAHVPLSDYESYKPFIDRFNEQPCKEENVKDMFSPGLPDFFALSSATSGTKPKILPKYNHNARLNIPTRLVFNSNGKHTLATVACTGYKDIKVIERAPGEVAQKIPVCVYSGGTLRRAFGWYIDDEHQMSSSIPGYAVPWAATLIEHFPSLLIIHGLFFLVKVGISHFVISFAPQFVDLIRHIDERWDMLLSCIRDGTLPDLQGMDHVRKYIQAHFRPNPERALELLEIGRPFSCEGWFARVWPNVKELVTICSGPFATAIPKIRSILGPNVSIRLPGYYSSEAKIGVPPEPKKLDEFVLKSDEVVEFLDVSLDETHENVCQAWEVQVWKDYEPILTTRDGLWRYRLGDVVHIIGFQPESNSPIFKYAGRRSLTLRFRSMQITDDQLVAAILAFSSEDAVPVQEFTTVFDDRVLSPAVGFFVELRGPLGPNVHLARQKLFDALDAVNNENKDALADGRVTLPTIRVVKAGTFAEYRQWKGEKANIPSGQIKVPVVVVNPTVHEWLLERVDQEL